MIALHFCTAVAQWSAGKYSGISVLLCFSYDLQLGTYALIVWIGPCELRQVCMPRDSKQDATSSAPDFGKNPGCGCNAAIKRAAPPTH